MGMPSLVLGALSNVAALGSNHTLEDHALPPRSIIQLKKLTASPQGNSGGLDLVVETSEEKGKEPSPQRGNSLNTRSPRLTSPPKGKIWIITK